MTKGFQPMLAAAVAPEEVKRLSFPLYASPKLDGVRAVVRNGVVLSRKLKPIPSLLVQDLWGIPELEGLDGEIITGPANAENAFRRTTSTVMSINSDAMEIGATNFHVFDCVANGTFAERVIGATNAALMYPEKQILAVPQQVINNMADLEEFEAFCLIHKFEGVMLRSPDGPYKFGRSTLNEGWLLKLKRFADDEYEVTGLEERMHNANERTMDERGYAKRSSHQENLVGTGRLGAYLGRVLTGPYAGKSVKITPTGAQQTLEEAQASLRTVRKFKYFPSGSKDLPRFPTDLGPRKD